MREPEPKKEPVDLFCLYCGDEIQATWKIITQDGGEETVCDDHHLALKKTNAIQSDEEILWEAQWRMENEFDENFDDDDLRDIDPFEDGSLYGF